MKLKVPMYQIIVSQKVRHNIAVVLDSGHLASGPMVEKMEKTLKTFTGAEAVMAVNSGTAALHAALHALGIGPGDEVLVPAFTFIATVHAVLMVGATPVFVDIEAEDFNVDVAKISENLNKHTKAVIAVDLFGQLANYDKLMKLARNNHFWVLEDAAQAIGAKMHHRLAGNVADAACFSFYATKNVMAGEGGAVLTNRKLVAKKVRQFRNHGRKVATGYAHIELGYNYRMSDLHAAVALGDLTDMLRRTKKRQAIALKYSTGLGEIDRIQIPITKPGFTHVYHQYTIRLKSSRERDQLRANLGSHGIETGVYYPKVLYDYPHLRQFKPTHDLQESRRACATVLSLPIHPTLTEDQTDYVIDKVISWAKKT